MTARLLASAVWVPILVTPPLRGLVRRAALLVWPAGRPFDELAGIGSGFAPLAVGVALGYAATAVAARALIRSLRESHDAVERRWAAAHGGDYWLAAGALILGGLWLGALLAGAAGHHWPLVLGVVAVGLARPGPGEPRARTVRPPDLPPRRPVPTPPAGHLELIRRRWQWLAAGPGGLRGSPTVCVDVVVPKAHYDDLRGRDHGVRSEDDFAGFARQGLADAAVGAVASQLRQTTVDLGLDQLDEIHLVMSMTQSYPYLSDAAEHGGEYPRYPVETLVDQGGDCEDFALLAAALLGWLGHRVAVVTMKTAGSGHAGIAVGAPQPVDGVSFLLPALGVEVFYAEVTPPAAGGARAGLAWKLGQQPFEEATDYRVYPLI